jgi:hypothetical protein
MKGRQRRHDGVLQEEGRATDHQRALGSLSCLPQPVVGSLQLHQQRRAGFDILRTIRGELESAASAPEQGGAEFRLERPHQLGDGLQRHALLARHRRQAAGLRRSKEVLNGLELVHLSRSVA